jgi:heme-degrading monooxygenase HmoA
VIIRVFRPRVRPGHQKEFEDFLRETAVPLIARQQGLIAQHVGLPFEADGREFVYVTVWQDVASIRSFAGDDWQAAVIDPSEEHMLEETAISHYIALGPDEDATRKVGDR